MGKFKPGQLMMMDFGYFSITSVRGYSAYFSVTCQATGYGFIFPVPNKRPPLSLISWIAETLKRLDRQIYFVRFDEARLHCVTRARHQGTSATRAIFPHPRVLGA